MPNNAMKRMAKTHTSSAYVYSLTLMVCVAHERHDDSAFP
jgi:hypothetical protein